MTRYWDAVSDLDAYPYEDESTQWHDREPWDDTVPDWPTEVEDGRYNTRREKGNAESPRRQKLFRKAEATIAVMVALRGVYGSPVTVTAWYGRHGRRLGLFTYYDDDHEIQWTPRRGFRVIEIQDLPF